MLISCHFQTNLKSTNTFSTPRCHLFLPEHISTYEMFSIVNALHKLSVILLAVSYSLSTACFVEFETARSTQLGYNFMHTRNVY